MGALHKMEKTTRIVIGLIAFAVLVLAIVYGFGGVMTGNVSKKETIKIGFIGPLTGDAAGIGQNSRTAVELAVEEVNAAGGINGKNLEIIYEDGQCTPKTANNAANKLVNLDKVPAIIGGECSSETLSAAPVAEGKTVMVSPCSSAPGVTQAGDYIFRAYPSDTFQGKESAEVVYNKLKASKAAILYCLSDYCVGIKDVFKKRFAELGGKIVADEGNEQTSRDLKSQLTKIKEANPDVIYLVEYTEAEIIALKQIKELGIKAQIIGTDTTDDPKIWQEAGSAAEGMLYSIVDAPMTNEFKAAMRAKTGNDDITVCTPQAYDVVKILAKIIKEKGTSSEAIKNALYSLKEYDGISGKISFDSNGDLKNAKYVIKVIKNGKSELFSGA